jgi:hypothetical protein
MEYYYGSQRPNAESIQHAIDTLQTGWDKEEGAQQRVLPE